MINDKCKTSISSSSPSSVGEEESEEQPEEDHHPKKELDFFDSFQKLRQEIDECKKRPVWRESIRKKFKIADDPAIDRYLEAFFDDMQCKQLNVNHFPSYFTAWLEKRLEKEAAAKNLNTQPQNFNHHGHQPYHPSHSGIQSRLPLTPKYGLIL